MSEYLRKAAHALYVMAARRQLIRRGAGRRAFEAAYILYKHLFEAGSPKRLASFIVEGTTVIDVGANIGFFTLPFARLVGPQGRVIALEPERMNFRRLASRLNGAGLADRVLLFSAAAAEKSGPEQLLINPNHPGDHKLSHHDADNTVEIKAHALDDLLATYPGPPVSLIKIDVQGAELRVIMGARELVGRDRPALLIEIDPAATDAAGAHSAPVLLTMLAEQGYAFRFWMRRGASEPRPPEAIPSAAKSAGYLDVLCLPKDR